MTQTTPWAANDVSTEASVARRGVASIMGAPLGSFTAAVQATTAGGGHGVVGEGDLLVTQHAGTPGMSVDIAVGACFVRGSSSGDAGCYVMQNTAVATVAISAADVTNPRKDLIVAQVNDDEYDSGGVQSFTLEVLQGTPAGSPNDPAVPDNCLVLARVAVSAGDTSITNGEITDLRTFASGIGGIQRCTSAKRPSGASLYEGLAIYELDTGVLAVYDGSAWAPYLKLTGSGVAQVTDVTVVGAKDKRYTASISGSYQIDAANGPDQSLTMTGNVTFGVPLNLDDGESIMVELIQDATGGRTATYPGSPNQWLWFGGATLATAGYVTTANAKNVLQIKRRGSLHHAQLGGDLKI